MVVLIDTNVIIDFLVAREPFYDSALRVRRNVLLEKPMDTWRFTLCLICGIFLEKYR